MYLTKDEITILNGEQGKASQKSMEILAALGKIYGAEKLIPINSVQISGVSYANLGEAGLEFLAEMADGGGKVQVLTTLNPAGMDVDNWQALGISQDFAENQTRVLEAFERMGVVTTCSCTPYLFGNLPTFGQHIAWAESSAVCFANAVLGARTNREGGPSALAASIIGKTPAYGLHLNENRVPTITIEVENEPVGTHQFGALGKSIGDQIQYIQGGGIPYITGISKASLEELKSFCASIATFGGVGLFHIAGITPEAGLHIPPANNIKITANQLANAYDDLNEATSEEVDFVSLGCPHLSLDEIKLIAELIEGKTVTKEFWITTSRPVKHVADRMSYTEIIQATGAKFAVDTCCVVAPIKGRFNALATDSAKACYYANTKNRFKTRFLSFAEVIEEACK